LIKSPMAGGIAAFASQEAAEQQRAMLGGSLVGWSDLLADTTADVHNAGTRQ